MTALMLCSCGGSTNTAEAQSTASDNATVTDALTMGLNGKVKSADAPMYLLGIQRLGFDTDGYVNDLAWAMKNGTAQNIKKDQQGRLASFTMIVDECDEEIEYTASISRDSDGRISKILYMDVNYTFEYDDSGHVAKVSYLPNYDPTGGLVYRMEYNPEGDLVKTTRSYPEGSVDTHRFEYNYAKDPNGNWLKRVEHLHQNGEDWDPRTEERSVEYY